MSKSAKMTPTHLMTPKQHALLSWNEVEAIIPTEMQI